MLILKHGGFLFFNCISLTDENQLVTSLSGLDKHSVDAEYTKLMVIYYSGQDNDISNSMVNH